MAKEYLDKSGLTYFWGKLKNHFQDKLVSGTNIKTINNQTLLGSGNISISGGGSVLDFYPVGSYYETSDSSFDPNVSWGGTWLLETAGQVHVSAGTGYTIGDTGGNKDAIIPYHNHGFIDPTIRRDTDVGVSVAAHGITQPAFKLTQTAANVYHSGEYVSVDQAMSWGTGALSSGSTYKYLRSTTNPSAGVSRTSPTIPEKACTRTTDVGLTKNHEVSVTQPKFSAINGEVAYAGTNGNITNANMQPYIVVNRWHRTA